jgi:hypothetical protein
VKEELWVGSSEREEPIDMDPDERDPGDFEAKGRGLGKP